MKRGVAADRRFTETGRGRFCRHPYGSEPARPCDCARRGFGDPSRAGNARGRGHRHLRRRLPGRETAGDGDDERGIFLSTNALATVCIHPGIPLLMLIGHSGGVGEENAGHATVGALTEPVLQAMHIVYEKVGRFEEIRPTIRDSQMLARSSRRPTAIVLNKQALR